MKTLDYSGISNNGVLPGPQDVEVMCKPGPACSVGEACRTLAEKIKAASRARVDKNIAA